MFSIRLKELREKKGYFSQQSFADAFGVAQSTVGGWESGKREPNHSTTIKLANFLGVTVDALLGVDLEPNLFHNCSGYWDGSRLLELREELELTTTQIASLLEISEEEYIRLESNDLEPSFELLLRMADHFSYNLDYLCHRVMKLETKSSQHTGTERLLLKMYRSLGPDSQGRVWNTLNYEYQQTSGEEANFIAKEA